ncbi:MAG: hypothetical protein D6820_06100 [Lentisphaerae bacterium]|nr:MAG: hypothetical protein D6820_06100 [Lentisphaerota bacterium]
MQTLSIAWGFTLLYILPTLVIPSDQTPLPVPRTDHAITIDGRLDESAWNHAATTPNFTNPIDQRPGDLADLPQYMTSAKLLWDPEHLYITFICHSPGRWWATFTQHDSPIYKQDVVEIFLRISPDLSRFYELLATPNGTTFDCFHHWLRTPTYPAHSIDWRQARSYARKSVTWDLPGFIARGETITSENGIHTWIIECAIPLSPILTQHKLPPKLKPGMLLYLNLLRYIYKQELDGKRTHFQLNWSPTKRGCPHLSPMAMLPIRLLEPSP